MSDRLRKRLPGALTGALVMALALAGLVGASDVPLPTQHVIDAAFDGPGAVFAADVDGDGDTDVLGAATEGHTIAWWENTVGDGTAWLKRTIVTGFGRAQSVFAADMDGDGDLDALGAAGTGDRIDWWENTAGNGTAWNAHTVAGFFNEVRWALPADIDADGDLDVVAAASFVNTVAWWENTAGNGTAWTRRNVDTAFGGAISVDAADVDSDGDLDILGVAFGADDVAWWENTAGDGTAWTKRIIDANFADAWRVVAADVDSDGDMDVLGAGSVASNVTWWENTAGDGTVWSEHTVGGLAGARSVYAADVDGDGDVDALGAGHVADDIVWWENTTGDGTSWIAHTVDAAFDNTQSVVAADVDSDGDVDVLGAAYDADTISWWENETIHRSAVYPLEHLVDGAFDNPRSVFAADVDADGDTDLLGAANAGDDVAWWENTAGDGSAWTEHMIDPNFNAAAAVFAGDVDGDGDLDALAVAGLADDVTWWENTAGDGSTWTEHTIDPNFNDARGMYAGDVDSDGDLDVVAAAGVLDDVAWWENTAGDGSAWTKRTIDGAFDFAVSVFVADVDSDGDLDVLGAASGADTIAWWENTAGDGTAWSEHSVAAAFAGANSVYAADLDSDGDLDVAGAAGAAGTITWWENTAGDGTAWSEHAVASGFTGAYAVVVADVDSDGDLDVAGAAQTIDTIAWWENRGGQFALPTTGTAPAVLGNGQSDDLLAIAATHRGRSGDHDVELVTFELVFEQTAGDPLTSAEANALIANLFVYRDDPLGADPGNFDPADTLAATVATLALDGSGLQTVSFTDGDPNLQVVFGTPRTYFVAVELTATASAQTPNSFRVTHLTETTSSGEDRDFDIPLDLEYAVNTSSAILLAVPMPGFSKSFGPNPIFAAGVSTLVLTINNLANAFAVTGLDFTDVLPAGLVVATPSNAATTCTGGVLTATPGAGVIAYTGGTVAASGTCAVSVGVTTTVDGVHVNTSGELTSMLGSSGLAADALTVLPLTDLAITKGDAPDPVVAGTGVTYTLTVANQGPSDATGVVASDTLPAGVSFVSASPGCAAAGSLVICTIGNLAAGASTALTINATVNPAVTGTITNLAGVTGNEADPNLPNTVTETTAVVAEADLVVTKSDRFDPVAAGGSVSWILEVTNFGPSNATGVVVTDTLPPAVRLIAASSSCTLAGQVVLCTAGDLPAGAGARYEIAATVGPAASGPITNIAGVTGNQTDPNLPNTAAETTTIIAETDLAIAKSAAPEPVVAGSHLSWTLQVTNHGPSLATGVVAVDTLPPGVRLVSASPECAAAEDRVTCTAGDLTVGAGAEFTLEVMVDPAATGVITNTAAVSGNQTDPSPGNNRAVATAEIALLADLVLTQSDSADPVRPGDELTWTVTVTNHGPAAATEVAVTDVVPQGVALVATSGCAEDPTGTPDCTLGTIPAGEARSYELTVTVDPGVAGTLLHSASATSAVTEARPGDEASTETTEVTGDADLAVELSGPATAVPGGSVRYTLTVTNLGPDEAVGVRVLDYFVPELVGVSWSRGQKQGMTSGILDDVVDLAAAAAVTYDITATVAAEATDTVGHSAFVESGGVADPNPVNDAATTAAELRPAADLRLALGNGRAELIPGKAITYTATVSNPGPSDAPPVRLTGTFPLTDATVVCTDCEKSIELDETFAVPAGGSVTWVVAGTVPADAEGTLVSEAAIELPADFDDPDPSNNQAMDVDQVIPGEVMTLGPPRRLAEGRNPAVVFSDSGRSLVVFEQGEAGGTSMIRGLEIDASGVPGNDFPLSTDVGLNPAVDLDADLDPDGFKQGRGAHLTVWQEELEPSAVLGQLSRDGRPLGPAMGLSTRPTSQVRPDVVKRPAGGFLVVWESTGADAEEEGIFGRFVDPAGRPVDDGELRINRATDRTPQRPALASDGSRFLVVWDRPASGERRRIAGQRLSAAGELAGATLELSDAAGSQTDPAVAFDQDSERYLVAWRQEGGAGGGIAGRVFDPAGRPQGEPFLIGSEGDRNPEVSSEEGNFTVVWERALGARSVTFGQLIDPEGRPVGSEFRVSGSAGKAFQDDETGGAQPAVAYAPHGAIAEAGEADVFAVIWGDRTAADEDELSGQRYAVTADLLLTVFDDPDPLPPGASALVYTVVVQNLSTADAEDVVVIHRLPAGVTLVVSQGCAEDPTAVEFCTLGTVEGGAVRQYVLETRVAPGIQGTLPLPATVNSSTPDPDQNDNVADELTRFGIADLRVDLIAAAIAGSGERATWRLVVTNAGPSPAGGSVLALELPLGVSVVASDGCGEDPSATETCTLGTLGAGAERRVELEVEYARTLTGTVTPSVNVASGVYDPDLTSNADLAAIEVLGTRLEVKIEAPARVAPGIGFTYAVTVTNAGSSPAAGVEIVAPLPAGLSLAASGGCAEDPSGMPVCTLGTLDPGAERRVSFAVVVPEDLRGTLSFGVNVRSSEAAALPTASATTVVAPAEVLELMDGRFAVRVEYRNQHGNDATGTGQAIPFSKNTGFFYFFDPANVELVVKVLDGGALNGHFWFFYGALTDLVYEVLVRDRLTGWERSYYNPAGEICGVGDTQAFPWSESKQQGQGVVTAASSGISSHPRRPDELSPSLAPGRAGLPPLETLGECTPGAKALCLSGGRFRVEVTWRNQHAGGVEGPGRAVAGTDDSGYFWFFDADNLELAVKLLDGRGINGRFWFFYGGLSDVEYGITVTDTETGVSRTYHNPPGEICGGADVSAF